MRFPCIATDFWELRSAEEAHRRNPDTFWIPPEQERNSLSRGQAVKLIFDIECYEEDGSVAVQGERMWVIVSEAGEGYFVGILDSSPASFDPSDDTYLCFGAEVPFRPEHVIDIAQPPQEYVDWQLEQKPERLWPRERR
jgi:hypothetical protein